MLDNNQIRRKILQILYDYEIENPGGLTPSGIVKKHLQVEDKIIDFNLNYLENKGYLKLTRLHGSLPLSRITSGGIDIVEDNNQLDEKFPLIHQTIVHNSPGTVIDSQNVSINIVNSFNQIYEEINQQNPENRDLIIEKVNFIERELGKKDMDKSKVRKMYEWLQRNANWIMPSLSQVMVSAFLG